MAACVCLCVCVLSLASSLNIITLGLAAAMANCLPRVALHVVSPCGGFFVRHLLFYSVCAPGSGLGVVWLSVVRLLFLIRRAAWGRCPRWFLVSFQVCWFLLRSSGAPWSVMSGCMLPRWLYVFDVASPRRLVFDPCVAVSRGQSRHVESIWLRYGFLTLFRLTSYYRSVVLNVRFVS